MFFNYVNEEGSMDKVAQKKFVRADEALLLWDGIGGLALGRICLDLWFR